jgi:membrane-associated phospholipid phosphatase
MISGALALHCAGNLAFGSRSLISATSDVGQVALPSLATALPLFQGDIRGAGAFGLVLGTALGATELGKSTLNKSRPDTGSTDSYPSGHTASAFAAASFLHKRHGVNVGLPAYLVALHTGIARVRAGRHYLDDVIAGAGIGILSSELWSCILHRSTRRGCDTCAPPRWRVEFSYGGSWQTENDVAAPADNGTDLNLSSFQGGQDVRPTARVSVQYFLSRNSELVARVDPAETRGSMVMPTDTRFGAATFPAGSDVRARWLSAEYRLRWRTHVPSPLRSLRVRAGATLLVADYTISLETDTQVESVDGLRATLLGHAFAEYRHTRRLSSIVSIDVNPGLGFRTIELEAGGRVHLPRGWDVGLRYRWSWREIKEPIDNDPVTHAVYLTIARSF